MTTLRLGILGSVLVVGWAFIAFQNDFHVTPPLVFVMLGYFAVVMTTYNLWRTGAAAVEPNPEDDGDAAWGAPIAHRGLRGELEREKRTMLKAIKEAEFDYAMGKLSKGDADQMIAMYRARAIEVIKQLDEIDSGAAATTRDRILREVKARAALGTAVAAPGPAVFENPPLPVTAPIVDAAPVAAPDLRSRIGYANGHAPTAHAAHAADAAHAGDEADDQTPLPPPAPADADEDQDQDGPAA